MKCCNLTETDDTLQDSKKRQSTLEDRIRELENNIKLVTQNGGSQISLGSSSDCSVASSAAPPPPAPPPPPPPPPPMIMAPPPPPPPPGKSSSVILNSAIHSAIKRSLLQID